MAVKDEGRNLGVKVEYLTRVEGHGNILVEVKDGAKPPSARQLTDDQIEFRHAWRGDIYIVERAEDVHMTIQAAARAE